MSVEVLAPSLVFLGSIFFFFGLSSLGRPSAVIDRLSRLRTPPRSLDEVELQKPFSERVVKPLLTSIARNLSDRALRVDMAALERKVAMAGYPGNLTGREFYSLKLVLGILLGVVTFGLTTGLALGLMAVLFSIVAAFLGYSFPDFWLSSRIRGRQEQILAVLPDTVDLLSIGASAGLSFDGAIQRVCQKWDNVLTQELSRALTEIRMGRPRGEALKDIADRTGVDEVISFIGAVLQSQQLGVSVVDTLRGQARLLRQKYRQRLERKAHQAPIKMMIPLVLFLLPAMFVVILGPTAVSLAGSLLGGGPR